VDVAILDDDVAKVHADPEGDPLFLRCPGIAFSQSSLHGHRARDGFDDARELEQNAVPGRLDDAPAMFVDFRIDLFAPMRLQPGERAFLIGTHKPAVSRDVGGENGGQPAFDASRGQKRCSLNHMRPDRLSAFRRILPTWPRTSHSLSVRRRVPVSLPRLSLSANVSAQIATAQVTQ
jgi:hypothetical protein